MIKKSVVGRADALLKTYLFSSVGKEKLVPICENHCQNKTFQKGKTIFSKNTSEKCIGIIADGTASVKKERVVINHLKAGDIFGAVTLYNDCDRFVNDIVAQTECTVIFISKDGIDSLLSRSPEFAKKYIKYLSQRVYFLNEKIEEYTAPSAKDKLLSYFKKNAVDGSFVLNEKMTELSKQLNISRASLYRAIDELYDSKKIEKDGNKIRLL